MSYLQSLLVAVLCMAAGCHSYKPAAVNVIDAETTKPIAGASVETRYIRLLGEFFFPKSGTWVTDANGNASIRVAKNPSSNSSVDVRAQSEVYIPGGAGLLNEEIAEASPTKHMHLTIQLYSLPEPVIEIVLMNNYRGIVKIEKRYGKRETLGIPGQRLFSFSASPNGDVYIPRFQFDDVSFIKYQVRYANGQKVEWARSGSDPSLVRFRWIAHQGSTHIFVVGTQAEADVVEAHAESLF